VISWHTKKMQTRILFVEDDNKIRHLITTSMNEDGYLVTDVESGEDALTRIENDQFDIAIVDLRLPGISGLEVVRRARKTTAIPIVVLTAFGDSHDVVAALEAGADDFLNKPIGTKELSARIRAILRRISPPIEEVTDSHFTFGTLAISIDLHEATSSGRQIDLTRTEFQVLKELIVRSPKIVTRHDLLESVWGYDYLGDSRLVDMQIYRLRSKLAECEVPESIQTIRGVGFKIVE